MGSPKVNNLSVCGFVLVCLHACGIVCECVDVVSDCV